MRKSAGGDIGIDIMRKYAKPEKGQRLLPSEVWAAVDELSRKKHLTFTEKEELSVLQYTQQQMRMMYSKGPEPKDINSIEHQGYINQLNRKPITLLGYVPEDVNP